MKSKNFLFQHFFLSKRFYLLFFLNFYFNRKFLFFSIENWKKFFSFIDWKKTNFWKKKFFFFTLFKKKIFEKKNFFFFTLLKSTPGRLWLVGEKKEQGRFVRSHWCNLVGAAESETPWEKKSVSDHYYHTTYNLKNLKSNFDSYFFYGFLMKYWKESGRFSRSKTGGSSNYQTDVEGRTNSPLRHSQLSSTLYLYWKYLDLN